jgi:hypothetical protein
MRQRILGSIVLTWGLAILANALRVGIHGTTVGYKAGEVAAWLIGAAMVYFGARTIVRALRQRASK